MHLVWREYVDGNKDIFGQLVQTTKIYTNKTKYYQMYRHSFRCVNDFVQVTFYVQNKFNLERLMYTIFILAGSKIYLRKSKAGRHSLEVPDLPRLLTTCDNSKPNFGQTYFSYIEQ